MTHRFLIVSDDGTILDADDCNFVVIHENAIESFHNLPDSEIAALAQTYGVNLWAKGLRDSIPATPIYLRDIP